MTDEEIVSYEEGLNTEAIMEILLSDLESGENEPVIISEVNIVDTDKPPTNLGPNPASTEAIKDAMEADEGRWH